MLKNKHKNMKNNYLKNILNILTEAYDYVKLTEAVPYSVAKEYLEIERSPEAETRIKEVFNKLKSLPNARQIDKRGWRIAFPYAEDSTEFEIQSILEPYDFSIKNYKDGLALDTKSNKEIAIGKALNKISKKEPDAKELLDRYAAIKGKGATNKDEDLMMVFSSAKYDIVGMSTGRDLPEFGNWDSCMNVIKGSNRHYVKLDLKEGSIICYLTTISDTNLKKPLGRVLIKPYINTENKEDVVLYAELKTYGKISNSEKFMDEVDDYMEKTQKLSGSYERLGCLYKDSQRGEIEGKETIRTRALKKLKDEDKEGLSKSEFVSLPLENKRQYIDRLIKEEIRLFDFQYAFASQSQKKEYIKMILSKSKYIKDFEYKGAPKDSKVYIINFVIDNELKLPRYMLDEATPEQQQKYLNIRMNNNNSLEDYELKIATPEQREKHIDIMISTKVKLSIDEFKEATDNQKEKYIDSVLELAENDGDIRLKGYETVAATEKQQLKYLDIVIKNDRYWPDEFVKYLKGNAKEKYIDYLLDKKIDNLLDNMYGLSTPELEIATPKQKEIYIDTIISKYSNIKRELKDREFRIATPKQKEKYIDLILKDNKRLGEHEFDAATPKQKEKDITFKLSKFDALTINEFEFLTPKQKSEYIDNRSNSEYELNDYEYELMSKEQLDKHFTNLIDSGNSIADENYKYVSDDIMYYFLNKVFEENGNLDIEEDAFNGAPEQLKNAIVKFKISNNLKLSNAEKKYKSKTK
jgi:hypothetical protein